VYNGVQYQVQDKPKRLEMVTLRTCGYLQNRSLI